MSNFRIAPIDRSLADRVRRTLMDPIYGLPVRVEAAMGYGPCRLCLRTFSPGERRVFFHYNAFSADQESDLAGPVFIHLDECAPYEDDRAFPEDVAALPIELRGYDRDRRCVAQMVPARDAVAASLDALFDRPDVEFVHVRNTEAKCFIARAERSAVPSIR